MKPTSLRFSQLATTAYFKRTKIKAGLQKDTSLIWTSA